MPLYRKELMELMLRLGATWIQESYSFKENLADHIDEFFRLYIHPPFRETTMYDHRELIRENKFLNKLLNDNNNSLRSIFERYKNDYNNFTRDSAVRIFKEIDNKDL